MQRRLALKPQARHSSTPESLQTLLSNGMISSHRETQPCIGPSSVSNRPIARPAACTSSLAISKSTTSSPPPMVEPTTSTTSDCSAAAATVSRPNAAWGTEAGCRSFTGKVIAPSTELYRLTRRFVVAFSTMIRQVERTRQPIAYAHPLQPTYYIRFDCLTGKVKPYRFTTLSTSSASQLGAKGLTTTSWTNAPGSMSNPIPTSQTSCE